MTFMDKLRALLAEADEPEVEADPEAEPEVEVDPEAEPEVEVDPEADEPEVVASENESPEVAELRAQLTEQAATIEALRNRLAAAGIEDDVEPDPAEIEPDEDTTEEDAVAAFESDYAEREAALAEITKDN